MSEIYIWVCEHCATENFADDYYCDECLRDQGGACSCCPCCCECYDVELDE